MRLALGAYSGPRAVCGAVAQLAKNATQIIPAIRRMDIFVSSRFIGARRVQTVGDDSEEVFCAQQVFLKDFRATSVSSRNSRASLRAADKLIKQIAQELLDFAFE
jgi:hypothetical protein